MVVSNDIFLVLRNLFIEKGVIEMLCDVSGKVTFTEMKKTKDGAPYTVVKLMQADQKGNVNTVQVRVFNTALVLKGFVIGEDEIVDGCSVTAYKSGIDRVGLSVDKW